MMPVEVPLRVWTRAPVSCESVGEAGGPLQVALRRSLNWAPWKVLRVDVPRGKRVRSGVTLLILWVDGDVAGALELELGLKGERKERQQQINYKSIKISRRGQTEANINESNPKPASSLKHQSSVRKEKKKKPIRDCRLCQAIISMLGNTCSPLVLCIILYWRQGGLGWMA